MRHTRFHMLSITAVFSLLVWPVFSGTGHSPLGHAKQFIAISSRLVNICGNQWFGHLSIERWEPIPSIPSTAIIELQQGVQYTTFELLRSGYSRTGAWELLKNGDGGDWVVQRCFFGVPSGIIFVDISTIHARSRATEHVIVVYKSDVSSEWGRVSANATTYGFAEQSGFNGVFQHWPNSRYELPPGNNSNTFIRWLAAVSSIPLIEPPVRLHPGRSSPQNLLHPIESCGNDPVLLQY